MKGVVRVGMESYIGVLTWEVVPCGHTVCSLILRQKPLYSLIQNNILCLTREPLSWVAVLISARRVSLSDGTIFSRT